MDITNGGLSFVSTLDNSQMDAAVEETLRRIQGLSDGTVAAGDVISGAFGGSAANIRKALSDIGAACASHEQAIAELEAQYRSFQQQASTAMLSGKDEQMRVFLDRANAIQGEIRVRKQLLTELRDASGVLDDEATKIEQNARKAEENAAKQDTLRQQIKRVKDEMAALRAEAAAHGETLDETTGRYAQLKDVLGDLTDIQGDMQQQARILSNDEKGIAGVISGLSGLSGGASAVAGAFSLLGSESDDLQKVMTKLQSVMSITIGLQQVQQTLNKDSAFSLVTLRSAKEWWASVVAKANVVTAAETAAVTSETAAEVGNTAATAANTAAATAGTVANTGLAGAFRLVGAAIKSIPGFGWIAAAVSALVGVVGHFISKTSQAKKAAKEFSDALTEGCYKPIGKVQELSVKWNALGDSLEDKKKFIEENRKAFDELGVAVSGVTDAENLLTANKEAFIQAQVAKAKATVMISQNLEKVQKALALEQEIAGMSDTKTVYYQQGQFGGTMSYTTANTEKEKKKQELADLNAEITKGYEDAAKVESEGVRKMEEAGIKAAGAYASGTVGAIEKAISEKQEALKNAASGTDYKAIEKEIESLNRQLDGITGKKSGGTGNDAFTEKLNRYKSEYQRFQKWANSSDETIAKAANREFEGLLKEGATYIDYLKKQRDQILAVDVENRSKEQTRQLRQLNDAISEETKQTVLESFNAELSSSLTNAKTTIEMLKVIQEKRKELTGDGTEVDNAKKQSLDDAENDVVKQQQEQTQKLLDDYGSYLDRKLKLDMDYADDLALLQQQREKETTDEGRAKVDAAIKNRTEQYRKDSKGSGDEDYDRMLTDYATFEQKKQAIIDEYDEKRRTASEHGDTELVERLNDAQAKALSQLASSELTSSEVWNQLFGNLDELTVSQIGTLVNEIEAKFDSLSGQFDPVDLNAIRDKLNQAKNIITSTNPFKQLGQSFKAIFKDAGDDSKTSSAKIKKNWTNLANSVDGTFDFVSDAISSCEPLKNAIGEVGATALSSMQAAAAAAIGVATAIKTAEKSSVILAIIQAALVAVQAIFSLFQLHDKKIEKSITEHQKAVDSLKNAYTQLSWEVDKALGSSVYDKQKKTIENMQEQQKHIQEMIELENSKKKTDSDKIDDYREQIKELNRDIADAMAEMADDILQTDAKSAADELGDALVEAFSKGKDAADSWGDFVNDIIRNAIVNQLKKNFLEQQLQSALNGLMVSMGWKEDGTFQFNGLSADEIADFKNKVKNISEGFNQALEVYSDIFKDLSGEDADTSLSGAVKGVSEETASILAGQMNAIRINQMESTEVLRQQLIALNQIASNTSYNYHLAKLERIVSLLENGDGSLRSQGLVA